MLCFSYRLISCTRVESLKHPILPHPVPPSSTGLIACRLHILISLVRSLNIEPTVGQCLPADRNRLNVKGPNGRNQTFGLHNVVTSRYNTRPLYMFSYMSVIQSLANFP
jgi:hypothetical protein